MDTTGIAYSNDYVQNFSFLYQDSTILTNLYRYTLSRGTIPGELYLAGQDFSDQYHIFHSFDYVHTLEIKQITEPLPACCENISFTAGRAPGSFYMLRYNAYSSYHADLWISYSNDYGATFTTYYHSLDSTLTRINQPDGPGKIFLWPNPASGKVTLDFGDQPEQLDIKVIDLFGRACLEKRIHLKVDPPVIDVSALPEGIYFLQCQTSKHLYRVEELVVQRP
jgi:hypothetical protein